MQRRLDTVDSWVFASQSAADYFLRVYDPIPPESRSSNTARSSSFAAARMISTRRLIFDEPLRVAFVGLGWPKKGLEVVNELAEAFRGTSVEIHHFGELRHETSPELRVHGPYDNEFLPELLHRAGIQVVLLPGPYAETFGIVMTEALVAGLPVIGARYGALGERIRAQGAGWTIDPMDHDGIRTLIERLDRCRDELMRVRVVPAKSDSTAWIRPPIGTPRCTASTRRATQWSTTTHWYPRKPGGGVRDGRERIRPIRSDFSGTCAP